MIANLRGQYIALLKELGNLISTVQFVWIRYFMGSVV